MNSRTKKKLKIFVFIIFYVYYLSINQPVRYYILKSLTQNSTVSLNTVCDKIIDTRPRTAGEIFKILCESDDQLTVRADNLAMWARMFQ